MKFVPATAEQTALDAVSWLPRLVHCPEKTKGLEAAVAGFENYLLKQRKTTIGWLALKRDGIVGFVIRPEYHGHWLSRGALRSFADTVFINGREVVTFDTNVPKVLKLALRLGAKPIYDTGVPGQYGLSRCSFAKGRLH